MKLLGAFWALVLALGLGGCAESGALPKSPAQGGRSWVEVSSPHFRVLADLSTDEATRVARELESGLGAIEQVAFAHSRTPLQPTTVVVFSDSSDYHAFMPSLVLGTFTRQLPGDLEPASFLVLYGELTPESRIACLHELTHDLFDRNFGAAPPWLNEGWAQYYSTAVSEGGHVTVGRALPHLSFTQDSQSFVGRAEDGSNVFAMSIDDVAPPSVLLTLDRHEFYESAFHDQPTEADKLRATSLYLGSWALVHMMHDGPAFYTERFNRFIDHVRTEQVQAAWRSAFAGVSDRDFDRDFKRYLARREIMVFDSPDHHPDAAQVFRTRVLADPEVHVLWARLSGAFGAAGAHEDVAKRELDQAVSEAPASPEPRYFRGLHWLTRKDLLKAEPDLLAAAKLEPREPRFALAVLALRIEQQPENATAGSSGPLLDAARVLAPIANSPTQLRVLAQVEEAIGEHERALGYAQRAVALSPIGYRELEVEASILNDLGRIQEAVDIQSSAVAFVPETEDAKEASRQLSEYQKHASTLTHAPVP